MARTGIDCRRRRRRHHAAQEPQARHSGGQQGRSSGHERHTSTISMRSVLGDPFPISATNMLGLGDLLDEMVKHFPQQTNKSRTKKSTPFRLPWWAARTSANPASSTAFSVRSAQWLPALPARRATRSTRRLLATASATTSSTPQASAASAPLRKNPSSVTASMRALAHDAPLRRGR